MLAILRCFWTDRAIWVKSFVTLKLLEPLETLAKRAARSAVSTIKELEVFPLLLTSGATCALNGFKNPDSLQEN